MKKSVLILLAFVFISFISNGQCTTATNNLTLGTLPSSPTQWLGSSSVADIIFKTSNVERMRILSTGNFGIGTTSPSQILHVKSPGNNGSTFFSVYLGQNSTGFANALNIRIKDYITDIGADYVGGANSTNLTFSTRYSGGSLIEKMRIDASGNVGIGTSSLTAKLTVNGNAYFGEGGASGVYLGFDQMGGDAGMMDGNGLRLIAGRYNNLYVYGSPCDGTGKGININTVNNNVGIGTQTPGSQLQVNGSAAIGYNPSTSAPANGLLISGKVGIGTTNPIGTFQVGDAQFSASMGNCYGALYGTGYIGFNAARLSNNTWSTSNNGQSPENGGSVVFGDVYGAINFATIINTNTSTGQSGITDGQIHVYMKIKENGNVGIGTSTPTQKLEIYHSDATGGIVLNRAQGTSSKSEIKFSKAGTQLYSIGNDFDNNGAQTFFIWDQVNSMAPLLINQQGKVIIGGATPPTGTSIYKLYVEGGICTRDVMVTAGVFPDYVFEKEYPIMAISDLEKYINVNKHLPGIPSASEIDKNGGYEIGDMQERLIKVVEEQTLYIIDLQKQIDALKLELINSKK